MGPQALYNPAYGRAVESKRSQFQPLQSTRMRTSIRNMPSPSLLLSLLLQGLWSLTLSSPAQASSAVCSQAPYSPLLVLSKLPLAMSYCSSHYPIAPIVTVKTAAAVVVTSTVATQTTTTTLTTLVYTYDSLIHGCVFPANCRLARPPLRRPSPAQQIPSFRLYPLQRLSIWPFITVAVPSQQPPRWRRPHPRLRLA